MLNNIFRNKIYMYWFRPEKFRNFGDELGPYIVNKLTGKKIVYLAISGHKKNQLYFTLTQIYRFILGDGNLQEVIATFRSLIIKKYLVTVGSIIEYDFSKKAQIWGSGLIKKNGFINYAKFYAVRGELTKNRLQELHSNIPIVNIVGDPAILLSRIFVPKVKKIYKIGIIPHVIHFKFVTEYCSNTDIKIISLKTNNIEKTIEEICSCEMIITSSLHGLIVPHTYGIPAIRCNFPEKLNGDGTKFSDYFSSVNIVDYNPVEIEDFNNISKLIQIVLDNYKYALPNIDLKILQDKLLMAAPFRVSNKYIQKITSPSN